MDVNALESNRKDANIASNNESVPPELRIPSVDYINVKNNFSGARFLRECCTKVNANVLTMTTAATYYHKFFAEVTFDDYDPYLIAATCIYLASKTQNDDIKLRDIINVSFHCVQKSESPLQLDEYFSLRDSLVEAELLVMRILKFDFSVELPHKHMLLYLSALRDWLGNEVFEKCPVIEVAWTMLLDSYHLPIALSHSPQVIAGAMIYLAFQIYGIVVPGSNEMDEPCWFSVLHPDCTTKNIWNISSIIIKLYALENKLNKQI